MNPRERAKVSPCAEKNARKPGNLLLSGDCGRLCFLEERVQVIERLLNGQGIHFTSAIFTGLYGPLQIMSRNLNRHGIGNDFTGLLPNNRKLLLGQC